MRIGLFEGGWWARAAQVLGGPTVRIRTSPDATNPHQLDVAARLGFAQQVKEDIRAGGGVDLLLDHAGAGILLEPVVDGEGLELVHECLGVPLVSHFIDPIMTSFQSLDWAVTWQALSSGSWLKGVWDAAQVRELNAFGVPGVFHLRMAAPVREYDTSPIDAEACRPVVSFVGGQNSRNFNSNQSIQSSLLFPAVLAHGVRQDMRNTTFLDVYDAMYGVDRIPRAGDDLETQWQRALSYYNAKVSYNAYLSIQNRDRFVIFLKRHLGDCFELTGSGWKEAYGLDAGQPIASADAYFDHFRKVAINLNFVNGNAEDGLNMRHFEVTAAGGFLMCYDQPELHECFDVGRECVAFKSEADLLEKIRYYLERPEDRVRIAAAGQARTLSRHLYTHRLRKVVTAFEQDASSESARRGDLSPADPGSLKILDDSSEQARSNNSCGAH